MSNRIIVGGWPSCFGEVELLDVCELWVGFGRNDTVSEGDFTAVWMSNCLGRRVTGRINDVDLLDWQEAFEDSAAVGKLTAMKAKCLLKRL